MIFAKLKETVRLIIEQQRIEIVYDCEILDWDVDQNTNRLKCLLVNSASLGLVTINCDALVNFEIKKPCSETLEGEKTPFIIFKSDELTTVTNNALNGR